MPPITTISPTTMPPITTISPTTTRSPTTTMSPTTTLTPNNLPNYILEMNPIGWYDANSYDPAKNQWNSKVGNSSFKTKNLQKANSPFPYIYGTTASSLFNIPWTEENSDYTFIHLAKYNGDTRGRIWTGTSGNWLSGFWSDSVSFFHNDWIGHRINIINGGKSWLLSVDMNNFARVNKGEWEKSGPSFSPESIVVNEGPYGAEKSDFAIAEFLIFKKKLTKTEYTKVENYLIEKYALNYSQGEFFGPNTNIWNDTDCPHLLNVNGNLEACKIKCNNISECTAFNFNPNTNECILRRCTGDKEPSWNLPPYQGYSKYSTSQTLKQIQSSYILQDPNGIKNGNFRNVPFSTFGLNDSLSNWTINIKFKAINNSNMYQGIIGNIYNPAIPTHTDGWGFWLSPYGFIHFRISGWNEDLTGLGNITNNVEYQLTINWINKTYIINLLKIGDQNSARTEITGKPKLTSNKGSICLGGWWQNLDTEKFQGSINLVDVITDKNKCNHTDTSQCIFKDYRLEGSTCISPPQSNANYSGLNNYSPADLRGWLDTLYNRNKGDSSTGERANVVDYVKRCKSFPNYSHLSQTIAGKL
jgi:hypothetical protein